MMWKKLITAREVCQGQESPRLYGLAYWDYCRHIAICYPIPLNLLVRFLSHIWWSCKQGLFRRSQDKVITEIAHENWTVGYKDGRKGGLKDGKREGISFGWDLLQRRNESDEELQKAFRDFMNEETKND